MNREQVIARIDDWEERLNSLYGQIESWYRDLPASERNQILKGSVLQRDESPMKQFDIQPRMLPTLSVLCGKNRVSFVPSVLWIVGANGRVNATTNKQQFVLVDMGGAIGQPSDWQIVTSQLKHVHRPFDQSVFNDLVLRQLVEAA